ncbi:MAG: hypothetical protein NT016_01205 [Candidatus Aenigmarchaeota archaeon]|nr:hypothetical protein [Candidatus Aenigmarchaeota archaeon]
MKTGLRFWILAIALAVAAWYIMSPLVFSAVGLKVTGISAGASCGNLRIGDIITNVGGVRAPSLKDFQGASDVAKSGDRVSMIVNGGPGGCTAIADGNLGVTVEKVSRGWVRLGTDISGGNKFAVTAASFANGETPTSVAAVIKQRLGVIGLKDAYTSVDGNTIYAYLPNGESVNPVIFPGKLEVLVRQPVPLSNGTATIKIGGGQYSLSWDGVRTAYAGVTHALGEPFDVSGVKVTVSNFTNASLTVDELIFGNGDITPMPGGQEHVAYDSASASYVYSVPVELSPEASKRFADVVGGLQPLYGSDQGALNGVLVYSIDGSELSRLSIPSSILNSPLTSLSITGNDRALDNAVYKKKLVDMALNGVIESGVQARLVGAFEGEFSWVTPAAVAFIGICIVAIFIETFIRDKRPKLSLLAMAVPLFEIVMIIAVAELSQSLADQGWVVDGLTLAGVAVSVSLSAVETALLTEKSLYSSSSSRFSRAYMWLSIAAIVAGTVISFTLLNRFGLAIAVGGVLGYVVVKPFYEEYALQFRH